MIALEEKASTQDERAGVELDAVEARQGIVTGRILTVLLVSLTLSIAALAVVYFVYL